MQKTHERTNKQTNKHALHFSRLLPQVVIIGQYTDLPLRMRSTPCSVAPNVSRDTSLTAPSVVDFQISTRVISVGSVFVFEYFTST
jgi:hypothetical protein